MTNATDPTAAATTELLLDRAPRHGDDTEAAVEEFLRRGGVIQRIPAGVSAVADVDSGFLARSIAQRRRRLTFLQEQAKCQ